MDYSASSANHYKGRLMTGPVLLGGTLREGRPKGVGVKKKEGDTKEGKEEDGGVPKGE